MRLHCFDTIVRIHASLHRSGVFAGTSLFLVAGYPWGSQPDLGFLAYGAWAMFTF